MAVPTPPASGFPTNLSRATTAMSCQNCPNVEVVGQDNDLEQKWFLRDMSATDFRSHKFSQGVTIIFAKADDIRECSNCLAHFKTTFHVPDSWWSTWCRRSNGYFGAEHRLNGDGKTESHITWLRFMTKRFLEHGTEEDGKDYVWYKFNILTHWNAEEKSTYVLVFDPRKEVKRLIVGERLASEGPIGNGIPTSKTNNVWWSRPEKAEGHAPRPLINRIADPHFMDPFLFHAVLLEDIVYQQDEAVWGIRDRLRDVEKDREKQSKKNKEKIEKMAKETQNKNHKAKIKKMEMVPQPDYERIHEVARHGIHVSETLDVAVAVVESIQSEHKQFLEYQEDWHEAVRPSPEPAPKASSTTAAQPTDAKHVALLRSFPGKQVKKSIAFAESKLRSLRFRSLSNMERLRHEIQLAFNTVAKYDADITIQIGRAAQRDSSAMKTIAFLTLIFLPATFISSIFSMSFFNFDPDKNRWRISNQFWIYWIVVAPITALTAVGWQIYWKLNPPDQVGKPYRHEGVAELARNGFLGALGQRPRGKRMDSGISV